VLARDVANERSDVMTPAAVQSIASDIAAEHGFPMTVLVGDELLAGGLNLLHAVGRAARCDVLNVSIVVLFPYRSPFFLAHPRSRLSLASFTLLHVWCLVATSIMCSHQSSL
jgi:hypothetical protein